MSPQRTVAGFCWAAGLSVALAFGLLWAAWSSPSSFAAPSGRAASVGALIGGESPRLVIDPDRWWMVAGNSTALAATWTGIPPGCTSTPLAFRWSMVAGWSEGTLGLAQGPVVPFNATTVETGGAEIEAGSVAFLTCADHETAVVGRAFANVTVVAPPHLGPLEFDRDPVAAGASADLVGTLVGGEPPYRLHISWEDGSSSDLDLSAAGPFSFPHAFGVGSFVPSVTVEDSVGLTAHGSVEEAEHSGTNFTVGIQSARPSTEVGVDVNFTGGIEDPPSQYSQFSACSNGLPVTGRPQSLPTPLSTSGHNFTCAFGQTGTASITYEVIPTGGDLAPASATLLVPVAPALGIGVRSTASGAEVGRPTALAVNVTGGIAPFLLEWGLSGNPNASRTTLAADGTYLVPIDPAQAGSFGVTAVVEDAAGVEASNATVLLSVEAALNATAAATTYSSVDGAVLSVSGSVLAGGPPFLWFVAPGVVPENGSPLEGNLSVVSDFDWTGVLPAEGNASVVVGVIDGDGTIWSTARSVGLVPPLGATAVLTSRWQNGSTSLELNLSLEGGLAPYVVWTNSTDGPEGNATVDAAGAYAWSWPVNRTGSLPEEVVVRDRLGVRWTENTTVDLAGPPPGASTPPPPALPPANVTGASTGALDGGMEAAGGVTAVLLLVAGGWWYRRRRRAAGVPAPPPPDPVAVLRQIIEPADGVDRATVELLAEEAGLSLPTVRATLGRLVAEGRLRSETGSDGEEVYAWSRPDRA